MDDACGSETSDKFTEDLFHGRGMERRNAKILFLPDSIPDRSTSFGRAEDDETEITLGTVKSYFLLLGE